jgi:hypothetical protein
MAPGFALMDGTDGTARRPAGRQLGDQLDQSRETSRGHGAQHRSAQLNTALDLAASSAACALGNGVLHPLETIKVREMIAPAGRSSAASIAFRIVREEGAGALYAGICTGLLRAVVQVS